MKFFNKVKDSVSHVVESVIDTVKDPKKTYDNVVHDVKDIPTKLTDATTPKFLQDSTKFFTEIPQDLSKLTKLAVEEIPQITHAANSILSHIPELVTTTEDLLNEITAVAKDLLNVLPELLKDADLIVKMTADNLNTILKEFEKKPYLFYTLILALYFGWFLKNNMLVYSLLKD